MPSCPASTRWSFSANLNTAAAALVFPLPEHLRSPREVLRVDAHGIRPVSFNTANNGIALAERCGTVNIFLVSPLPGIRQQLESRRAALVELESSVSFDPARNPADLDRLRSYRKSGKGPT